MQEGSVKDLRRTFDHLLQEVLEMMRIKRGGTIVFNVECPPSEDPVLSSIFQASMSPLPERLHDVPYSGGILLDLFDTSHIGRHDGAVFINLFDEHTRKCAMKVHSR